MGRHVAWFVALLWSAQPALADRPGPISVGVARPVQEWQVDASPAQGSFVVAESALDGAGNLYLAGTARDAAGTEVVLVKLDAAGRTLWRKGADSPRAAGLSARAAALAVDGDGRAYVAAATARPGSLDRDFVLLAFGPDGQLAWQARIDGGRRSADLPNDVAVGGGLVIVTGSTVGARSTDYLTLAFGRDGSLRWRAAWDSGGDDAPADFGQSLAVDGAGHAYVAGPSGVVAYDAAGHERWALRERAEAIALAADGALYATAPQQTLRISARGAVEWRASGRGGVSIGVGPGGVWTAGTELVSASTSDVRTRAFDRDGRLRWERTFDHGDNDLAKRLSVDAAGNAYLLVESWLPGGQLHRVEAVSQVVKYDPTGRPVWTAASAAAGDPGALALDGARQIYATGLDGVTVKWREGARCPWYAFWCR